MPFGRNIRAWRVSRGYSLSALAAKAGLPPSSLEVIEAEDSDPAVSLVESLALAIGIPAAWMFGDPKQFALLTTDSDGEVTEAPEPQSLDPVTDQILRGAQHHRELYVLLTALIQSDDLKIIRAAEASLRSLAKQARRPTVPWQSRPSGHFEPPSD